MYFRFILIALLFVPAQLYARTLEFGNVYLDLDTRLLTERSLPSINKNNTDKSDIEVDSSNVFLVFSTSKVYTKNIIGNDEFGVNFNRYSYVSDIIDFSSDAEGDKSKKEYSFTSNIDELYVFYNSNKLGKVEFGKLKSLPTLFRLGVDVERSDNLSIFKWWNTVDPRAIFSSNSLISIQDFILFPSHRMESSNYFANNADENQVFLAHNSTLRFSYYTPDFLGFSLGFSYVANDRYSRGFIQELIGMSSEIGVYEAAVAYNWGSSIAALRLSATMEYAQLKNIDTIDNNSISYDVGMSVSIYDLVLSASYGEWLALDIDHTLNSEKDYYYTLGIGYNFAPFQINFVNFYSDSVGKEVKSNEINLSLKVNKRWKVIAGYTKFELLYQPENELIDRTLKGSLVQFGAEVMF